MDTPGREADLPAVLRDDRRGDGQPVRLPALSRLDENDAILVLDNVLVPWENVFVYGDVEKSTTSSRTPASCRALMLHGCTRLAVKLDFIAGLMLKAVEADRHGGLPQRAGPPSAR